MSPISVRCRQLSAPRGEKEAERQSDGRTGLNRPRMVFEVQRKDGSNEALIVGRHFRDDQGDYFLLGSFAKRQNIYVMSEPTLSRLRAGFGQR